MGRSELETPPELWMESAGDGVGRPDEEKLSMLSTIRTTFHSLLYRDDPPLSFDSLDQALQILTTILVSRLLMISSFTPLIGRCR